MTKARVLDRFKEDSEYFEEHRNELLQKYPEQWIAIFNRKVAGTAPTFDGLLDVLEGKDIPLGEAVVDRLSRKGEHLILHA